MHVGFPSRGFWVLQWVSFNQFGDHWFNFPNNRRQLLGRKYCRPRVGAPPPWDLGNSTCLSAAEFLTWRVIMATVNTGSIILSGHTWVRDCGLPAALLHRAQGWRAARLYHTLTLGLQLCFQSRSRGEDRNRLDMGKKCRRFVSPLSTREVIWDLGGLCRVSGMKADTRFSHAHPSLTRQEVEQFTICGSRTCDGLAFHLLLCLTPLPSPGPRFWGFSAGGAREG